MKILLTLLTLIVLAFAPSAGTSTLTMCVASAGSTQIEDTIYIGNIYFVLAKGVNRPEKLTTHLKEIKKAPYFMSFDQIVNYLKKHCGFTDTTPCTIYLNKKIYVQPKKRFKQKPYAENNTIDQAGENDHCINMIYNSNGALITKDSNSNVHDSIDVNLMFSQPLNKIGIKGNNCESYPGNAKRTENIIKYIQKQLQVPYGVDSNVNAEIVSIVNLTNCQIINCPFVNQKINCGATSSNSKCCKKMLYEVLCDFNVRAVLSLMTGDLMIRDTTFYKASGWFKLDQENKVIDGDIVFITRLDSDK